MSSNYYKNGTNLSQIIKGTITTGNIGTYYAGTNLSSVTYTFNTINENPYATNFKINGTDIASNCIAYYIEGTGTLSSTISTFGGSWCSKIRAILIGPGGNGGTANILQQHIDQQSTSTGSGQTGIDFHQQHNTLQYGGGGGGGGFIYLSDYTVSSAQSFNVNVGSGGSGVTTYLQIAGTTVAAAGPGTNASQQTAGSGGGTQYTGTATGSGQGGQNGQGTTTGSGGNNGGTQYFTGQNIASTTYGTGGVGSTQSTTGYGTGSNGYYRIYFLTG